MNDRTAGDFDLASDRHGRKLVANRPGATSLKVGDLVDLAQPIDVAVLAQLDRDLDAALILEDDAGPTEGFKPALDLALAHIGKQGFIRFPIPRSVEAGEEIAVSGRAKLIKPRTIGLGMVAQLVSREAAQKLLKATERFDRPIDVVLQMPWVTGVFARSIVPSVVAEISADLGGTTLHRKGEPALAKLRREILRPLYRGRIALRSRFFTREPA